MKKYFLLIASAGILSLPSLLAQTQNSSSITYTYDASGNRIKREASTGSSQRKANPNSEEKKEIVSIAKDSLQVIVTPNPTVTGNFTIAINRKSSAENAGEKTEKPMITVYNPLGELIHQEAAQPNSQVNISLASYSKGVYIVKIQSGEEIQVSKVAYE